MIGGLNPGFLTQNPPVPHQGTTDIDLLFTLGVDAHSSGQDFSWIDDALETGGFITENKWRWRAVLGETPVLLEFLCDLLNHTADTTPLPGATTTVAEQLKLAENFTDPDEIHKVVANYFDADSSWSSSFAETIINTRDEDPEDQIRNDPVFGAQHFLEELDVIRCI